MGIKCGSWSSIGIAANGTQACLPIRCRKWECPTCGPREKRRIRSRLLAGAPDSLLTLTHKPIPDEPYNVAFHRLSTSLNYLFKRIRRRYPNNEIQYAVIWETTKAGNPHAHILLRAPFIPQVWLARQWLELTGAYIVDVRKVHQQSAAAAYVTKYLTKAPDVPFGAKRYRTSRNYSPAAPRQRLSDLLGLDQWHIMPQTQSQIEAAWKSEGLTTYYWQELILIGVFGPPRRAGFDPHYDQSTLWTVPSLSAVAQAPPDSPRPA